MLNKRFKLTAMMVAVVLAVGLTGCGQTTEPAASSTVASVEKSSEASSEAKPAESSEEESEASSEEVAEPGIDTNKQYTIKEFEIPDTETYRMLRDMKVGWNLGNCFDANNCDSWISNEMDYETAWCGAKATPELFATLKEAGFNTIRIPISWHNHLTDKKNFTISEQWIDRVQEVVDYCMAEDLYVIINIHHDNELEYMYPDKAHEAQSLRYVESIWTQVAKRFKDYDEKLLFESLNEPRMVGHNNEWWIDKNSQDCKDSIEVINHLNQKFVDVVRKTGGNNAHRYLVCPGYDAAPEGACNAGFELPTDPVDNDSRIIIAIHSYSPYSFALDVNGTSKWSSEDSRNKTEAIGFMNNLYEQFVANGVPVIIDEFGAVEKDGNLAERVDWAGFYVASARARGLTCVWWDNNVAKGNGERLGIIDRKSLQWSYPEIMEAIMNHCE